MKKTYQIPAMTVVNIQSERICQGSVKNLLNNTGLNRGGAGGGRPARGREVVQNDWEEWDDWEE